MRSVVTRCRSGALLSILCVAGAGCGVYGFSSSLLPSHIKSVALPLFENRTERGDLATALADSLTESFLADHTLQPASEKTADSVVEGIFLEYRREPFTVADNEQVLESKIEIAVEVRYVDVRKNQVIWEDPRLVQWATYVFTPRGAQQAESEETGIGRVLAKLTDDILNRTVEGW
jgi:hypothetical protein